MKCDSCGYNLNIEDKFCPHCGSKNIYAAKHSEDMEDFNRKFEATKEEVISNTRRFSEMNVKITIIAVLVALIAVAIIVAFRADDIRYSRQKKEILRNENRYIEQIKCYEADRNIDDLYAYMDDNKLGYVSEGQLRNYSGVYNVSYYYINIESMLRILINRERDMTYNSDDYCIKRIVDMIGYLKQSINEDNYNKELFTDERGEYIEYVKGLIEDTMRVYCHLTEDEAASIWDMTTSRLGIMIEEGILDE